MKKLIYFTLILVNLNLASLLKSQDLYEQALNSTCGTTSSSQFCPHQDSKDIYLTNTLSQNYPKPL